MAIHDYLETDVEDKRVDEKILNVIRRSDAGFVGTTEVSDEPTVDLKEDAVRKRLETLEEKGRICQKRIGHPEYGNLAWYLDEDERHRPVNPDIYWAAQACEAGRITGQSCLTIGGVTALAGMMLVMMSLGAQMLNLQFTLLNPSMSGSYGFAAAIAGFFSVFFGGILKFGSSVTESIVERRASPE